MWSKERIEKAAEEYAKMFIEGELAERGIKGFVCVDKNSEAYLKHAFIVGANYILSHTQQVEYNKCLMRALMAHIT